MQKILIISGQKYSKSNRSIDTITEYFLERETKVDHLTFGINKLKKVEKDYSLNNKTFTQLYSKPSYFSYLGKMGIFCPNILLDYVKKKNFKTVSFINWKDYDLIVLETGKPLFLLDIIPKDIPIICRQSDPLEISLRSNRDYFKDMEKEVIERSLFTLTAHEKAVEEYGLDHKIINWKSGFEFNDFNIEPNEIINNSLVYMGMFKIDLILIKKIALTFPNLTIHIIGNYKDTLKLTNVKFHGYLEYTEYIKLVKKCKVFYIPYHDNEVKRMKKLGLTSKFYIPMSLGKPILSRAYGNVLNDIKELDIFVYKTDKEAEEKLNFLLETTFCIDKNKMNFLEDLKIINRKKSLEGILKKYLRRDYESKCSYPNL